MTLPPVVQTERMSKEQVNADPVPSLDKGACRATDIRRAGPATRGRDPECPG